MQTTTSTATAAATVKNTFTLSATDHDHGTAPNPEEGGLSASLRILLACNTTKENRNTRAFSLLLRATLKP